MCVHPPSLSLPSPIGRHLTSSILSNKSTHLPSCRTAPLPSISPHSPLGGRLVSVLVFLSLQCLLHPALTLYSHLSLHPWHLLFLPLKSQRLSAFKLRFVFLSDLHFKQIVYITHASLAKANLTHYPPPMYTVFRVKAALKSWNLLVAGEVNKIFINSGRWDVLKVHFHTTKSSPKLNSCF